MAVGKVSVRYSQMLGSGILCISVNGWHYVHLYRLVSFENIIKWGLGIAVHVTVVSLALFFKSQMQGFLKTELVRTTASSLNVGVHAVQ